ncbi:MAG: hypothetical protein ABSG68_08185 [Thermoguttaceae bacterium]|jgi:hypothetical protein
MDWLDTETKALLQRSPPEKLAPPDTATFALVLLAVLGHDRHALMRAVQRAARASAEEAGRILSRRLPAPAKKGLTYVDAQIAQFELICCDAISVIIADEVVEAASAGYLTDLYANLQKIDEFEMVAIRIDLIPDDPRGDEFCDRFLSGQRPPMPVVMEFMRKKARIMQHWADKIGGRITIVSQGT